jgi:hypothetical protein
LHFAISRPQGPTLFLEKKIKRTKVFFFNDEDIFKASISLRTLRCGCVVALHKKVATWLAD